MYVGFISKYSTCRSLISMNFVSNFFHAFVVTFTSW